MVVSQLPSETECSISPTAKNTSPNPAGKLSIVNVLKN